MEYLSYDPNFTDTMEEDTDEENFEEEEDEYVNLAIKELTQFFLDGNFVVTWELHSVAVIAQMSIQMMRMPAGKLEELQLNAWQH